MDGLVELCEYVAYLVTDYRDSLDDQGDYVTDCDGHYIGDVDDYGVAL